MWNFLALFLTSVQCHVCSEFCVVGLQKSFFLCIPISTNNCGWNKSTWSSVGFLWLPQQSSTNWVYSLLVLKIEIPNPDVGKVSAGIEQGIEEESGGCWESLVFLGLLSSHAILTFYLYPDRKRTSVIGLGPTLIWHDLILTWFCWQRPYF